ncbi:MAG: efflux RND transporter periplasmic adaptor subunit [Myxococcales bacterium]|nr:efflux RND transporter periplasmic adaptor subunit [Myxococcales bacterium]
MTTSAPAGLDAPLAVAGRSALWRRAGLGLLVILAFIVGLRVGSGGPPATSPEAGAGGPAAAAASAAKEVIWTCSMHPQIRMREPGLCPICGMDLIPASEGDGASSEALGPTTLTPSARALAKVRTSPVLRREPRAELRLLGRVDYDESSLRAVTAWTGGRIDRLRVRVTGAAIRKGQVIATLYSPEVYTATRDLVQATIAAEKLGGGLHSSAKLAGAALESARERLRLLGVSDDQIAKIERERAAPRTVEIRSPFAGTVLERVVEEGDYVQPGSALFNVADLSKVWIQIDAYEPDLPYLRVGQEVVVEAASLPDEALVGKVAFIDPVVDHRTRTAKVRIEVENRGGQLRPGVFAEALIRIDADERGEGPSLVIPASAPLFTGRRSVVYVEVPGMERPTYELREVRLGAQAGPFYPVLAGLSEGEVVVTRGAFVLDADLQLAGGQSMMTLPDDRASAPTPTLQVPSELREALRPVVATYLDAQTHLAGAAIDEAREDLVRLAEIVVDLRPPGPKAARDAWQAHASALGGHARHAAQGKDAADLRRAFEHLSAAIEELLETFGNPLSEPLRIAYCPMAFDSRGAAWVQRDDALANPYYGAAMLRCGEFRATVLAGELLARSAGAGAAPAAGGDDHGHHH